jgi:beta-phosphoglucomutase-like phosphatase (HAD superfamily)
MLIKSVKAALFDVDGTLVLTEGRNNHEISAVARQYGAEITAEDWKTLSGQPEGVVWRAIAPRFPDFAQRIGPDEFQRVCRAACMKSTFNLSARPGMGEAIDYMAAKGLRRGIASNAACDVIRTNLQKAGALHFLGKIEEMIGEDTVLAAGRRLKPAPDPWLMLADRLGVKPDECIVFEDSHVGVTSARAAGMTVIQLVDHGIPSPPLAHYHAANRAEIAALCRKLVP